MGFSKASKWAIRGWSISSVGPALGGIKRCMSLRVARSGNESSTLRGVADGRVDTFARVATITF